MAFSWVYKAVDGSVCIAHCGNCGTIVLKVCNLTNHKKSQKHQ